MPRKPRFYVPGLPVHAVQRGHSREPVFYEDEDYQAYLGWLREGAERYGNAIHAYVLMTNHIHILVTPKDKDGISRMMQYVGRRYVPYINYHYGTSGTIWEGRYKASLVQEDGYSRKVVASQTVLRFNYHRLMGRVIHDHQAFKRPPAGYPVKYEIHGPYLVSRTGTQQRLSLGHRNLLAPPTPDLQLLQPV